MGNMGNFFVFLLIFSVGSEWLVSAENERVPDSHDYFLSCNSSNDKFNVELGANTIFPCPCFPEIMRLRCQGRYRSFPYGDSASDAYSKSCRNAEIPIFSFGYFNENLDCECSSRHFVFQCTGVRVAIPM